MGLSHPKSLALLERASQLIPGGVNSPVRAFRAVGGSPVFIAEAKGAYLTDVDGHRYVDYVGTWGPAVLGHARDEITEAICAAARKGTSFGAPTEAEVTMAEAVQGFFPSMQMMRMVSSGTEATMSALRVARGVTGRDGIVKFEGCYHGHADSLLVKAGSGAASFGVPDSAGIPADLAQHTHTLAFNDADGLRALFAARGGDLACVILEAITGNMGLILPTEDFLSALREVRARHGALIIFDEVMTGFRVHRGGAQAHLGFDPDLTCLGKVVGGGLPVGVYGGRAEYMRSVSPLGPVYQAGTLSGNPLATAAGLKTLELLGREGVFEGIDAFSARLEEGLNALIREGGHRAVVQRAGTMFTLFFSDRPVMNFDDAKACDHKRFGRFHRAMLNEGIYLPPSGYEACFVSAAHGDEELARTLSAARRALASSAQG
ncbi:MAG: glutamate-1-semialdehyde-2,1-aminomutase [Deltaproteobacteria bacterium]|nr:glutamate-1-semialdehyde-2,1-aminomutase [Deltaproteobacteria bacterium]